MQFEIPDKEDSEIQDPLRPYRYLYPPEYLNFNVTVQDEAHVDSFFDAAKPAQ